VNVADGKTVRTLPGHASAVTGLAFHPSGTVLASSSKDRTIRLWNPANPQPLKVLEGHSAWVEGVTFIHQGTRLASVGADQTVRIWDLTEIPKK
jgi:WD40 repeat protein